MMKLLRVKKVSGVSTMGDFNLLNDIMKVKQIIKSMKNFLGITIMDNYLLSRLLYQMNRRQTDIVIIYAGAAHIENYIDFFENHVGIDTVMEHFPKKNEILIRQLSHGVTSTITKAANVQNPHRCVKTKYPF